MSYQFITRADLPTQYGDFDIHVFENEEGQEHIMLTVGLPLIDQKTDNHPKTPTIPLVRIHSECLTGDAFASLKCDCGPQLHATMQRIQEYGCGALLYLRQEGRGIGLTNKIRAYALQDQGHDTLEANLLLGLPADARVYDMCRPMLEHVGVNKVRLLTNNPAKVDYLTDLGIEVVDRVPLIVGVNALNSAYLRTKRDKMGHIIDSNLTFEYKP